MMQYQTNLAFLNAAINGLDIKQAIRNIMCWALNESYPVALYRSPDDSPNLMVSFSGLDLFEENFESLPSGFVFASYSDEQYYLEADLTYHGESKSISLNPTCKLPDSLEVLNNRTDSRPNYFLSNANHTSTKQEDYIRSVDSIISATKTSDLLKAVPSKIKLIDKGINQLDLIESFLKLCKKYDNALVSLVSAPQTGTWLGVTPEVLIATTDNRKFETMSLAGTQKYVGGVPLHTIPWTQKEIEEQAMVSRYIINRFKEIRLREFVEVGPRTSLAGNLTHLCTTFTVDMKETNFPELGSVMLKLLHPTSAICGMPKDLAQAKLNEVEDLDRRFYAGFLGAVNKDNCTRIFVNLRCMEVFENHSALHSGAGITQYSNADEEWKETELKCDTLLNVINT